MTSGLPGSRWMIPSLVGACVLAVLVLGRGRDSVAAAPPAYELVPLPEGLDSLTSLEDAADRLAGCMADCREVVLVWTPRMPLSRSAIPNVAQATRRIDVGLILVSFEELERFAEAGPTKRGAEPSFAELLLAAGALAHAPSLVVFEGQSVLGSAILGYKTADAYASMLARRFSGGAPPGTADTPPSAIPLPERVFGAGAGVATDAGNGAGALADVDASTGTDLDNIPGTLSDSGSRVRMVTDFGAIGVPGAYFRWVPGRRAVAYESGRRIYLLDLDDGESRVAPGTIDFVPTPDGRYFVTPGPARVGLAFFDAEDVFEAARTGRAAEVRPFHADPSMRDQYPSVGILSEDDSSVRYRILTSWFEGLRYRDYEIVHATADLPTAVRPLGPAVVPCEGMELSTPIMSQDGREVAARDEATGTTKIYRFLPEGRCEEVLALGMPTRKVAWHRSGRKLAFSTPRVRTAGSGGVEPGIFVYDRDQRTVARVADSEGASQLAFPDFVGDESIIFLIPERQQSYFRLVSPIP